MPDLLHFSNPLNLSGWFHLSTLAFNQECFRATCYFSSLCTLTFDHSHSPVGLNIICKLVFPTQTCPLNSGLYIQLLLDTSISSIGYLKDIRKTKFLIYTPFPHPPTPHFLQLSSAQLMQLPQFYCFIFDSSLCFSYTISNLLENQDSYVFRPCPEFVYFSLFLF